MIDPKKICIGDIVVSKYSISGLGIYKEDLFTITRICSDFEVQAQKNSDVVLHFSRDFFDYYCNIEWEEVI